MIPVDEETHERLMILCLAFELGKRSQGIMVRKLVNAEYDKLAKVKLLPSDQEKIKNASTPNM